MKSILYANTIDYNFALQQRPQHLMNLLSKRGYMVYWVNKSKNNTSIRQRISDTLHVYHDWDIFKKRIPSVDIYFSSWSFRHVDLKQIECDMVIYDSLDNFEQNAVQEHLMLKESDVVFTTSRPLYNLRVHEHKNVHVCRNACFPELGNLYYTKPKDLLNLKPPIILFSGALSSSWCDLELVAKVAKLYTVVIVGMGWGINKMPDNVHYLGKKSYSELQAYYNHCDISILPFKRCQISDYSNPIKMYEAMAHGKITVATNIPEARIYKDAVIPSKTHQEFIENIKKALSMSKKLDIVNKCKLIALDNSWHKRVDKIDLVIKQYYKNCKF